MGSTGRNIGLLAALAATTLLWNLGSAHAHEHADSLLPVLVSLQRWTPFYWDQERFGMLVPLLAAPVEHPLWNLLLQRTLTAVAGLAALALLGRHVLAGRDWRLAAALALAGLAGLAPEVWRFEYLGDQPYGLSLALALAGLAVAEPGPAGRRGPLRLGGGLALVLLGHWVNAAVGVPLAALAVARAAADALDGERWPALRARLAVDLALLGAGLAAAQAGIRAWPALSGGPLRLALAPLAPAELPAAWAALLGNAWRESAGWGAAAGAAAALGVLLLAAVPALRPHLRAALLRAAALALAGLAYALFAGSLRWVAENAFHWRYLAPTAVFLHLAAASLLAEPLARLPRAARLAGPAALALVPLAALLAEGQPSLARVRADLDRVAGAHTGALLAARCTAIAGDYWTVWPAVLHAALVLRERGPAPGAPPAVYGVSHRSNPTLPLWRDDPAARVCVPAGEERRAERWLRDYGLGPWEEAGREGGLRVLARRG